MSLPLLMLLIGFMQQGGATAPQLKRLPSTPPATEQNPPEEDEALATKEYAFNPIQSQKEIRTGDYYWKKGKYKAAALRYQEATKWNNQSAEAFRKLGDAEEKQGEPELARQAYQHALQLTPDAKETAEMKKHLEKLQ